MVPAESKRLTIVHVIDSGGVYGAERVLMDLASESQRRNHRVIVTPLLSPKDSDDALGRVAHDLGLEVEPLVVPDGIAFSSIRLLCNHLGSIRPDVVHTHGYKANILAALLPKGSRSFAAVATLHGWTGRRVLSRLASYECIERWLLWRLDHVVAVSPLIMARVNRLPRTPAIEVIANGIAMRTARTTLIEPSVERYLRARPSILAAGRLSHEKGFDVLLRAMRMVVDKLPDARLMIAGEGYCRADLVELIHQLGLHESVCLPGYVADVRMLMTHFDLYVLSSSSEGLPAVLLEAMAERLPIVATRVGSVPQLLDGGNAGRLIDSGDVQALADEILKLLMDEKFRAQLSNTAYLRLQGHYSASAMADKYHVVYNNAVDRRRRRLHDRAGLAE